MKKRINLKISHSSKLIAAIVLLATSALLLLTVTVAWFTLSTSPEIDGIRITIAGDNTIMIAENLSFLNDENIIINYPGTFSKTGNLTSPTEVKLSPVSTADGVNWFIPTISADGEMIVDSLQDFSVDNSMMYANSKDGGYVYIDFWVVSQLSDCYLRLSTGDLNKSEENAELGSYLVQLPETVKDRLSDTGYRLDDSNQTLSSSVRVGFLVNNEVITTSEEMTAYASSEGYNDNFRKLKGIYGGEEDNYSFLIYEPNGLSHPQNGYSTQLTKNGLESILCENGEYLITRPIGFDENGNKSLVNIADRLLVQTTCGWKRNEKDGLELDTVYQNYLKDATISKFSEDESEYYAHIDYNFLQYVDAGHMFNSTWDLYDHADDGVVDKESLTLIPQNNVVLESNIVVLEKNVPQRIRMFVWLEGQDVDCNKEASGQTVALRLELAGSSGQ